MLKFQSFRKNVLTRHFKLRRRQMQICLILSTSENVKLSAYVYTCIIYPCDTLLGLTKMPINKEVSTSMLMYQLLHELPLVFIL